MKVYKTDTWSNKVSEVEADDNYTDKTFYINGRRRAWSSSCHSFFKTHDEAIAFLIAYHERNIEVAQGQIQRARSALVSLKKTAGSEQ